jgi:oligoribonuclease (3'-5' exoribonuclease)
VNALLWVDTETSGLKPEPGHALLEIALVVTDLNFKVLGQISQLVPADTRAAFDVANPYVQQMHLDNGLWAEHFDAMKMCTDRAAATNALSDYLVTWAAGFGIFPDDKSTLFCCQGAVGVDNDFLTAYLPRVRRLWGHRAFDISAWRDLVMQWYGCKFSDMPALVGATHRALDDALHMLDVARWIRQMFWRPT